MSDAAAGASRPPHDDAAGEQALPAGSASGAVHVTVNGVAAALPANSTVADLLAARGATGKPCAVEVNREIVPRSQHAERALHDGDAVEIVSFVGGG